MSPSVDGLVIFVVLKSHCSGNKLHVVQTTAFYNFKMFVLVFQYYFFGFGEGIKAS